MIQLIKKIRTYQDEREEEVDFIETPIYLQKHNFRQIVAIIPEKYDYSENGGPIGINYTIIKAIDNFREEITTQKFSINQIGMGDHTKNGYWDEAQIIMNGKISYDAISKETFNNYFKAIMLKIQNRLK